MVLTPQDKFLILASGAAGALLRWHVHGSRGWCASVLRKCPCPGELAAPRGWQSTHRIPSAIGPALWSNCPSKDVLARAVAHAPRANPFFPSHPTDGVWEFITSREAVELVGACRSPEDACQAVRDVAAGSGPAPAGFNSLHPPARPAAGLPGGMGSPTARLACSSHPHLLPGPRGSRARPRAKLPPLLQPALRRDPKRSSNY